MLSPRNVRSCGCLRMILRTRPRGHRPRFCSSVTSTPSFYSTIIPKSRRLSRSSMLGVVVDSPPRTVSHPEETVPLSLPHLNRLFETSFVWDFPDSQGRPPAQYPHNVDPCFSHVLLCLYVLCGKGQPVDQPPSHEPFWHPNDRYKYRVMVSHRIQLKTSWNHKPLAFFSDDRYKGRGRNLE